MKHLECSSHTALVLLVSEREHNDYIRIHYTEQHYRNLFGERLDMIGLLARGWERVIHVEVAHLVSERKRTPVGEL